MGRCYVLIDRGLLLVVVFAAGSYAPLLSHEAVSCRSRPAAHGKVAEKWTQTV